MNKQRFLLTLAGMVLSVSAYAGVLDQVNNNFGAGLNSGYMTYKESTDGSTFDKENGTMPALDLHVTSTLSKVYFNFDGRFYDGDLKYDGYYTNGSGSRVAFGFKNDRQVYDADIQLGLIMNSADNVQIIPYLDGGFHLWYRPIPAPPVSGGAAYSEKYMHYVGALGVKVHWALTDSFVLTPNLMIGTTIDPRLDASIVSTNIKLGAKPLYDIGLKGNYFFSKCWSLYGFVNYEQFSYGRSANIVVNSSPTESDIIFEPNSKTSMVAAGLGFNYIFA